MIVKHFSIITILICYWSLNLLSTNASTTNHPLIIILDPNGSDLADGQTLNTSIKSLSHAQKIIRDKLAVIHRNVEIRISPGRYRKETVRWTFTMPEHEIKFMPLFNNKVRPVFDGVDKQGTWFTLYHNKGQRTNLHFRYIQVENYGTAITFNGKREHKDTYNGTNRIYGCVFKNIGEGSTAAVRLFNSRNNEIVNNHFVNILRKPPCASLHAIYVAHMASGNKILRNLFHNCCGDPVRIRDFSNNNLITDNVFIRAGMTAAYTDWYCDHDHRNDCTKSTAECPSWDNKFHNNVLRENYIGSNLPAYRIFNSDRTTGCIKPTSKSQRVNVSENGHK